jgi:hypothetical protein
MNLYNINEYDKNCNFLFDLIYEHFDVLVSVTENDHNICPVGLSETIDAHLKSSSFGKVKSKDTICENDLDCPEGKCCEVLGKNICLYFRGKTFAL